jgi:hypothetical protein
MSNILNFPSEPDFEFSAPRADKVPEGAVMFAGLALTAWLPTIMWCLALNENSPIQIIMATQLAGAIVGLVRYQYPGPTPPRCVPMSKVPKLPQGRYPKWPKAA